MKMNLEDSKPREFAIAIIIERWPDGECWNDETVKRDTVGWTQPADSAEPFAPTFEPVRLKTMTVAEFSVLREVVRQAYCLLEDMAKKI